MKKKILTVAGVIILLVAAAMFFLTNGLSAGANAQLGGINLSEVPDGSYTGTYEFKRWTNTVAVHVEDHQIIGIDIVKDVPFAIPDCADSVFERVMQAQDTRVDVVSGATVTSKAYLSAVEDAFRNN